MESPGRELDPLSAIPSPARRLWMGLAILFAFFVFFAAYAVREVRWLEDFQVNVVQKNRKASLELLRLQNDAYLLALSIRDIEIGKSPYGLAGWRSEFLRLREDMGRAGMLEAQFAVSTPASEGKRRELGSALEEFGKSADRVFALTDRGEEKQARELIQSELEPERSVITETVARLLVLNDQSQAEATETIAAVYGNVKKDLWLVVAILIVLGLATGWYTFQANRKTFERLHHLAEQLQAQSEQLRKLSWKLIEVQETTLRQVARDLHDEFGQILTAIGAMLTHARDKGLEKNSPFVEEVEKVKQIVSETLETVRDSSQIFRPAIMDDFGLEQTLDWFVGQFSRQTGIEVHFERELEEGYFPPADAIHLYRVVQEALSNVARHSKAREAWVSLRGSDSRMTLEIRDAGAGFDVDGKMNRALGEGMGLMGMRERAEHLKGSLSLKSAPGAGTIVTLEVPMPRPAQRATADLPARAGKVV
jgi:signal transduction histidine kinase